MMRKGIRRKSGRGWRRGGLLLLCAAILLAGAGTPALPAAAAPGEEGDASGGAAAYPEAAEWPDAEEDMVIAAASFIAEEGSGVEKIDSLEGRSGLVKWESQTGSLTYEVRIPKDAVYNLCFTYRQLPCRGNPISLGVRIDGAYPFEGMEALELPRLWTNDGEVRIDSAGNEFTARQVELSVFQTQPLRDPEGVETQPYAFRLAAGIHTITLEMQEEAFLLESLVLRAPERPKAYSQVREQQAGSPAYTGEPIRIQGEDAGVKTSNAMPALADGRDASLTPASVGKTRINYIGSSRWSSPNETLSWTVEVPETGLYKLAFKFKQSELLNGISYRRLTVDGAAPFAEAQSIPFGYGTGWQFQEYQGEDGEPYLLYLEKGTRTLELAVTLSETAEVYGRLEELTTRLGDLYLNIAMITGENPDPNRDYDLFRQIPGFNETLTDIRDRLAALTEDIRRTTGKRSSSIVAAADNMRRVLESMLSNPYTAQQYKTDYYTTYTSLCSWLYDMKSMPLSLDEIVLAAPDYVFGRETASFLESAGFAIQRFFYSFQNDYRVLSADSGDGPQIKLWVNWGRDQTQILDALIQESFTPETGIHVNLEIVNAGIIKGILSGSPPDLSLHMARTEPINLAMRGALVDLKQFGDYESVMERFQPGAGLPYEYQGGSYALPDTQSFYVLFYRTDIFQTLGLKAPETWDEFLDAAVTIQRSNMNVWIPYTRITTTTTVNTGIGGLSLFPSLMLQNGQPLYTEGLDGAALDQTGAVQTFTDWIELYTRYKFPREANFYNRFRVGTMPMGIDVYTQYQTLTAAAPEIRDCWTIAPVPGVRQEDGSIRRTVSGAGTGAGILKDTGAQDAAWEFLKWWTRADIQAAYSNNVESLLGVVGRTASATVEALSGMAWRTEDLDVILEQWAQVEELPELPGGYYLSRALDQAFWNVTNGTASPKDSITEWNRIADNEIKRKIREYSALLPTS